MASAVESVALAPMVRSRASMPPAAARSRAAAQLEAEEEAACGPASPMAATRTALPTPPLRPDSREAMRPDLADEDAALSVFVPGRAPASKGGGSVSSRSTTADGSASEEAAADKPHLEGRPRSGGSGAMERQRTGVWPNCLGIKVDSEDDGGYRGGATVVRVLRRAGERLMGRRA